MSKKVDELKQKKLQSLKDDLNNVTGHELEKIVNEYIETAFYYGLEIGEDIGYSQGFEDGSLPIDGGDVDISEIDNFTDETMISDVTSGLKGHKL